MPIKEDILDTLHLLVRHANDGAAAAFKRLASDAENDRNDAGWPREVYRSQSSLNDMARMQSERWMENALAA